MDMIEELISFCKERDEMLLACDVDKSMAFHRKHNPGKMLNISRETAEIGLHKARTAVLSLPKEERLKSKKWLEDRGHTSMDCGTLS